MVEEMNRRIQTKSTKCDIVGRDEYTVKNYGCEITFPAQTFGEDTKVETSVIVDSSSTPEGLMAISPIFECNAATTLNKRARVEIETWAFTMEDNVFGYIYRKDKKESSWELVQKVIVDEKRCVSFFTSNLSIYCIFVALWEGLKQVRLPSITLENFCFISDKYNHILCVCSLTGSKSKADVRQSLRADGYSAVLPLSETVNVHREGEVKVTLRCFEPANLQFVNKKDEQDTHQKMDTSKEDEKQQVNRPVKLAKKSFSLLDVLEHTAVSVVFDLTQNDADLNEHKGMVRFQYHLTAGNDRHNKVDHILSMRWPIPPY